MLTQVRQVGPLLSDDVLEKINKLYKDIGNLNGKIEGLDAERKSKLLSLQNVIYGMESEENVDVTMSRPSLS